MRYLTAVVLTLGVLISVRAQDASRPIASIGDEEGRQIQGGQSGCNGVQAQPGNQACGYNICPGSQTYTNCPSIPIFIGVGPGPEKIITPPPPGPGCFVCGTAACWDRTVPPAPPPAVPNQKLLCTSVPTP